MSKSQLASNALFKEVEKIIKGISSSRPWTMGSNIQAFTVNEFSMTIEGIQGMDADGLTVIVYEYGHLYDSKCILDSRWFNSRKEGFPKNAFEYICEKTNLPYPTI